MQPLDYAVRRLLKLPLLLLAVSMLVFALSRVGGSPIGIYINHEMTPAQVTEVAARFALDKSLLEQYVAWLTGVLQGDFGWSGVSVAPVSEVLPAKFKASLELSLLAFLIVVTLGIAVGTFAGSRRDRLGDHLARVISISGASLPLFWFALMMLTLFYLVIPIAPLGRSDPSIFDQITHPTGFYTVDAVLNLHGTALRDALQHLALPAIVLGFEGMGIIARVMRSSLVDQLREDYVDSARAKGVPERMVIRRHARRNALVPTVTVIGVGWGLLLQGSVIVEMIFQWPGMGRWMADAVLRGDQATIMAFVLVTAVIFLVVNLAVDIAYAYLDRRVELGA